jgi:hypothetical protein
MANMPLQQLDVLEILRLGLGGLCFMLSLLAFWLIHREQKRPGTPRRGLMRAIYVFMGVNFFAAMLVALAGYFQGAHSPEIKHELRLARSGTNATPKQAAVFSAGVDLGIALRFSEAQNPPDAARHLKSALTNAKGSLAFSEAMLDQFRHVSEDPSNWGAIDRLIPSAATELRARETKR